MLDSLWGTRHFPQNFLKLLIPLPEMLNGEVEYHCY